VVLDSAGLNAPHGGGLPGAAVEPPRVDPGDRRRDEPRPEIWFRRRVRLVSAMRELWSFRGLALTLAERDLRVRYKQAALGIAWAVLAPIAMMLAFTLVFTRFAHVNTHGAPYALFSYLGLVPWTFFSTAVAQGGQSLINNVPLLNKLYCPREVFPIAAIADAAVDACIASLILLFLFPILGFTPKLGALYILPLLLLILVAFTLGVTLAACAIVIYMRDLRLLLPLLLQFGLFVTPVVYGSGSLVKTETLLVVYSIVNPLVVVIDGLRKALLEGKAMDFLPLMAGTCSSLVFLIVGFALFKRLEAGMADFA